MFKNSLLPVLTCFFFITCAPGSCEDYAHFDEAQNSGQKPQEPQDPAKTQVKALRIDLPHRPISLDPLTASDTISRMFVLSIYDRLTEVHFKDNEFVVQPLLLKEIPIALNKAQTKFRMQLNRGVYFHPNKVFGIKKTRELIADDINYSLKRFANFRFNNYHYYLLHGLISGFAEFRRQTFNLGKEFNNDNGLSISGLKVLDRYKIEIELERPHPHFFRILADSSLSIVPHEIINTHKSGLNRLPIGTGAFYLVKGKDASFELKKNINYFKRDPLALENIEINSKGLKNLTPRLPYLDLISLHVVEDSALRVKNFLSGLSDALLPSDAAIEDLVLMGDEIYMKGEYANNFKLVSLKNWDRRFILFNLNRPIVNSVSLRKVIAHLLYKEANDSPDTYNSQEMNRGLLPYHILGSEESMPESLPEQEEKFEELLTIAKQELLQHKGRPLLIYTRLIPGSQTVAESIKNKLNRYRIRLDIKELSFLKFYKLLLDGNYDLAILDWKSAYADAEEYFALNYNFGASVRQSFTGFNNPIYNKLYERAYGIADSNVRFKLFKQMQQILVEEVPLIPLELPPQILLSQKLIKNLNLHPIDKVVLKYLDLQETIEVP